MESILPFDENKNLKQMQDKNDGKPKKKNLCSLFPAYMRNSPDQSKEQDHIKMHHIGSNSDRSLWILLRCHMMDKDIFSLHLHGICYMLSTDFTQLE